MVQIVSGKSYIGAARKYAESLYLGQAHYIIINKISDGWWSVREILGDDQAQDAKSKRYKVFRICTDGSVERV